MLKVKKQLGDKRMFILEDGSKISFEDYKNGSKSKPKEHGKENSKPVKD